MKITFVAIALAAAALLVGGMSTLAHAKSGASGSYTGCLAKGDEAGTFKLTNVGDAKAEYELVGGGKDLAAHVGHKVEVTGTLVSGKEAAQAEGGKAESEAGHEHLRVTSMKHVAATCP
jgi:hypothetical protein